MLCTVKTFKCYSAFHHLHNNELGYNKCLEKFLTQPVSFQSCIFQSFKLQSEYVRHFPLLHFQPSPHSHSLSRVTWPRFVYFHESSIHWSWRQCCYMSCTRTSDNTCNEDTVWQSFCPIGLDVFYSKSPPWLIRPGSSPAPRTPDPESGPDPWSGDPSPDHCMTSKI